MKKVLIVPKEMYIEHVNNAMHFCCYGPNNSTTTTKKRKEKSWKKKENPKNVFQRMIEWISH